MYSNRRDAQGTLRHACNQAKLNYLKSCYLRSRCCWTSQIFFIRFVCYVGHITKLSATLQFSFDTFIFLSSWNVFGPDIIKCLERWKCSALNVRTSISLSLMKNWWRSGKAGFLTFQIPRSRDRKAVVFVCAHEYGRECKISKPG